MARLSCGAYLWRRHFCQHAGGIRLRQHLRRGAGKSHQGSENRVAVFGAGVVDSRTRSLQHDAIRHFLCVAALCIVGTDYGAVRFRG